MNRYTMIYASTVAVCTAALTVGLTVLDNKRIMRQNPMYPKL